MGRVVKTHPGKDGLVRVVTLKNKDTTLKRPLSKICLLPIDDNELPSKEKDLRPTTTVQQTSQCERITRSRAKKLNPVGHASLLKIIAYIMSVFYVFVGVLGDQNIKITQLDPDSGIYFEDIGRIGLIAGT